MIKETQNTFSKLAVVILLVVMLAGCYAPVEKQNTRDAATEESENVFESDKGTLASEIKEFAQVGKVIGCDIAANATSTLQDAELEYGKPDCIPWVEAAKGYYAVHSKYNLVFGANKGKTIFEVRSMSSRLNNITQSEIEKEFGKPAHYVSNKRETIIGYAVNAEYKLLFVFLKSKNGKNNVPLHHYSVFYSKGTISNVFDDVGREW